MQLYMNLIQRHLIESQTVSTPEMCQKFQFLNGAIEVTAVIKVVYKYSKII